MAGERSREFRLSDVLGALFRRDLSITFQGEMDIGSQYTVSNFMMGGDSKQTIDFSDAEKCHVILRENILHQHPKLAAINIEELEEKLDKVDYLPPSQDGGASRKAAIAVVKNWVDEQATKIGSTSLSIEELSLKEYPRIPLPSPQAQLFDLEVLTGQEAIDLGRPGGMTQFVRALRKPPKPPGDGMAR